MIRSYLRSIVLAFAAIAAGTGTALAQSTAFTYQGKLNNNAQPAEGTHDFRFKLFDAATGGTQIGTTQCVDNLSVTGGVFTATIDFGQQYITTGQRFLEIEVRKDTGLNCSNVGGFVVLAPRQPVTPTPTAQHAKTAFALAAADGSPSNAVIVDNAGNVGIGTAAPIHNLHVAKLGGIPAGGPVILLQDTGGNSTQSGYLDFRNGSGTETAWVGFGTPGDADFSIINARPSGDIVLNPFSGNVGIGTPSPTAKLQVNGDIRLGPAGQYRATAGEENLRIVRGTVDGNGQILAGTGYTVTHPSSGTYHITFSTPFASRPSITVSSISWFVGSVDGESADGFFANVSQKETSWNFPFNFIAVGPR